MKNTKLNKIIVFLIILLVVLTISTAVFAGFPNITSTDTVASGKLKTIGGMVLGIVKVFAVGVAIVMLVVIAIRYMTASPSERGELKKNMINYVIGALILFSGVGILSFIQSIGNSVNNAAGGTTTTIQTPSSTPSIKPNPTV
ncbi:MAG: pilin [Oscillospiraceae bacterium]|nr:pilin [Oscillospiraceae bacterium]